MLGKKIRKGLCITLISLILGVYVEPANAKNDLYDSVDDFIVESYKILLGRENPDDVGLDYWSYLVKNHNESLYDYMISLISSEEFLKIELSNEEFLNKIYKLLLNRNPDDIEKNYWLGRLDEATNRLGDVKKARIEVCSSMFKESFFNEFAYSLGSTPNFEDMNLYGVKVLREQYPQDKIDYVNGVYRPFDEIADGLYNKYIEDGGNQNILTTLPILSETVENGKYEEIKKVSGDNVERLVYALDYNIEFPYEQRQAVYISPFIQMNYNEKDNFVTLGLSVTSRGLGKEITNAELVLGDQIIDLEVKYNDYSKYDSKGLSVHEFEVKIKNLDDLENLDRILSSDLAKLRFTFDNGKIYLYNLYDKDRVRNTFKFMASVYSQMIIPYLFENQNKFKETMVNNLE